MEPDECMCGFTWRLSWPTFIAWAKRVITFGDAASFNVNQNSKNRILMIARDHEVRRHPLLRWFGVSMYCLNILLLPVLWVACQLLLTNLGFPGFGFPACILLVIPVFAYVRRLALSLQVRAPSEEVQSSGLLPVLMLRPFAYDSESYSTWAREFFFIRDRQFRTAKEIEELHVRSTLVVALPWRDSWWGDRLPGPAEVLGRRS
jgi:hypothetical protein